MVYSGDVSSGFVVVTPHPDVVNVSLLLIRPESQRHGIGRAVMDQVREEADSRGLPITLSCFRSNRVALSLYKSLGFRVSREDDSFIEFVGARKWALNH